jgi:hypothetical protein
LARGPLSLTAALRCATDVGRILHEMHMQNRAYGKIVPASVVLRASGAELLPSRGLWDQATLERDIHGFGELLYQVVTGLKVPVDASAALFRSAAPPSGPAGIRAAALRLAGKCLDLLSVKLTMQQASTEVRLLWVVARQLEAAGVRESAPSPFLVLPPALPPPPKVVPHVAPRVIPRLPEPLPFTRPQAAPPPPVHHPEPGSGQSGAAPVVPLEAANFSKPPVKPVELEPAGGNCPRCESTAIYHSKARSRFELQLVRWKIPICRCHRCYHRYVTFARLKIPKEMPETTQPRVKQRRKR